MFQFLSESKNLSLLFAQCIYIIDVFINNWFEKNWPWNLFKIIFHDITGIFKINCIGKENTLCWMRFLKSVYEENLHSCGLGSFHEWAADESVNHPAIRVLHTQFDAEAANEASIALETCHLQLISRLTIINCARPVSATLCKVHTRKFATVVYVFTHIHGTPTLQSFCRLCALTESADGINNGAVLWLYIIYLCWGLDDGRSFCHFDSEQNAASCKLWRRLCGIKFYTNARNEALSQSHHAPLFGVMTKKEAAEVCA